MIVSVTASALLMFHVSVPSEALANKNHVSCHTAGAYILPHHTGCKTQGPCTMGEGFSASIFQAIFKI